MTEDSVRSSKSAAYASETQNDSEVILMHLILDLQSENNNLHTPALRRLLDIVVDQPGSNKQVLQYRLIPILNKFSGIINQSEEYVLSTTILHIIGVRGNCDDKTVLTNSAIECFIQMIYSSDENLSKSGSKTFEELIGENESIRNSLLSTGFINLIIHTLTQQSSSSSSSLSSSSLSSLSSSQQSTKENQIPIYIIIGLLDVIHKFVSSSDDLSPFAILFPIIEQLKYNQDKEVMKRAGKIISLLIGEGINSYSSEANENKQRIHELEEIVKQKDEELKYVNEEKKKLIEDYQKEKRRADDINQRQIVLEQEKQREKQEKDTEISILKEENIKLKQSQQNRNISQDSIKDQDLPIAFHNPDPSVIDIVDVDGLMKKITTKQQKTNVVSLTQVLENGIYSEEIQFSNSKYVRAVGIVRDTYIIPAEVNPCDKHYKKHFAYYSGSVWGGGGINTSINSQEGNKQFMDNDIVKLEYDSFKGTLIFFVNGVQQPVYISGINEKVRFIISIYEENSSCSILSLKKLSAPTSKNIEGQIAVQW